MLIFFKRFLLLPYIVAAVIGCASSYPARPGLDPTFTTRFDLVKVKVYTKSLPLGLWAYNIANNKPNKPLGTAQSQNRQNTETNIPEAQAISQNIAKQSPSDSNVSQQASGAAAGLAGGIVNAIIHDQQTKSAKVLGEIEPSLQSLDHASILKEYFHPLPKTQWAEFETTIDTGEGVPPSLSDKNELNISVTWIHILEISRRSVDICYFFQGVAITVEENNMKAPRLNNVKVCVYDTFSKSQTESINRWRESNNEMLTLAFQRASSAASKMMAFQYSQLGLQQKQSTVTPALLGLSGRDSIDKFAIKIYL